MNIVVFGAKGRVGSRVVELAEKRGHTVYPIDVKNCQPADQSNSLADNLLSEVQNHAINPSEAKKLMS